MNKGTVRASLATYSMFSESLTLWYTVCVLGNRKIECCRPATICVCVHEKRVQIRSSKVLSLLRATCSRFKGSSQFPSNPILAIEILRG